MCGEKPKQRNRRNNQSGITPACAGKSLSSATINQGSPPRVRGKGRRAIRALRVSGITPACAGKREKAPLGIGAARDHPRVCGEKFQFALPTQLFEGSPPRMRGKGCDFPGRVSAQGITPAYAGKSLSRHVCISRRKDHPRVCGEKAPAVIGPHCRIGSPPRVRGKVTCEVQPVCCEGITPACAGKSCISG